jgi:chromosome segregation ATPase
VTDERIDYKKNLASAKVEFASLQKELGEALKRQEELEKKLTAIRQMIYSFSDVVGESFDEVEELGLTDAVRQAFRTSATRLTPPQVKARMWELGFDVTKYGNAMAAIHTVIGRLVSNGEITQNGTDGANKPAYQWAKAETVKKK